MTRQRLLERRILSGLGLKAEKERRPKPTPMDVKTARTRTRAKRHSGPNIRGPRARAICIYGLVPTSIHPRRCGPEPPGDRHIYLSCASNRLLHCKRRRLNSLLAPNARIPRATKAALPKCFIFFSLSLVVRLKRLSDHIVAGSHAHCWKRARSPIKSPGIDSVNSILNWLRWDFEVKQRRLCYRRRTNRHWVPRGKGRGCLRPSQKTNTKTIRVRRSLRRWACLLI